MIAPTLSYFGYELFPRAKLGSAAGSAPRKGALLRARFADRKVGYADCHPWPELGDPPLSSQLDLLRKNHLTELTQRSIEFARIDADARAANRSLWDGVKIPPSHALITDLHHLNPMELESIAHQGFTHLKLKVGRQPVQEANLLKELYSDFHRLHFKLRLDFNGALSPQEADEFIRGIGRTFDCLDYLEDVTPYQSEIWSQIQSRWGVRLALDRISPQQKTELKPESFAVLVFKPAIQSPMWVTDVAKKFKASVVVTSYLDHPLGQLCAAWTAAQLKAKGEVVVETCGLLSQTAYRFHPFAGQIDSKKSVLLPPSGTGFGMDDLLVNLEWTPFRKGTHDSMDLR